MQAIVETALGQLELSVIAVPAPVAGALLVRVRASGIDKVQAAI